MRIITIPCGPTANASEDLAIEKLSSRLRSEPGNDEWFLLTNLAFSVTHRMQSDEIDIIVVGPPGVRAIEVKHWSAEWMGECGHELVNAAELIANKARKVGTSLRKTLAHLPFVEPAFLLTQEPAKIKRFCENPLRGVRVYDLNRCKEAAGFGGPQVLRPEEVRHILKKLEPRSSISIDGGVRRFAGYVNLELQSPPGERFHRVYKGKHPVRQDRVVLHLYDLSADNSANALAKARREFEVLHPLQQKSWAPRLMDSFQEAPGYPGEMHYFTLVDPSAPSIAKRAQDPTFQTIGRIDFVRKAARALAEFHGTKFVHRNLTPNTILVNHDHTPILTGFERVHIPMEISVSAGLSVPESDYPTTAPEVIAGGLAAANASSDVYALCASLKGLFREDDVQGAQALAILALGTAESPRDRATLEVLLSRLDTMMNALLGISPPQAPTPPARFWTEGQEVRFRGHDYRIVNRLGSGGFGTAYKVVQVARSTGEELGSYVAKICHDQESGKQTLNAYQLVRSHLPRHPGLSAIFEVAEKWEENSFVSLMTWIVGTPFNEFTGVFPLLAEDLQEADSSDLALRWIHSVCGSLGVLHRNGLIHGDVSPRNLIVSGGDLVLTDFDFVAKVAQETQGRGTPMYSVPQDKASRIASPGDDIYALAASMFHVIHEREPFGPDPKQGKSAGLDFSHLASPLRPKLVDFLRRATDPDNAKRFTSVEEALAFLAEDATAADLEAAAACMGQAGPVPTATTLSERKVPWLHDVLRSYPGYPGGNQETRGLDSRFAAETYVETTLERMLIGDMHARRTRLVVLCGNAGDGKTALLQYIAKQSGLGARPASVRILEGKLGDGLVVRMNLDGSAAWNNRTADDLLDSFLEPFQQSAPATDLVHLLAINDGRLLEWLEGYEARQGGDSTPLTETLRELLEQGASCVAGHIRFISLNQRTLVGDVPAEGQAITTEFLDRLIDHLYGAGRTATAWTPCADCSAKTRCDVFQAGKLFAPAGFPSFAPEAARRRARRRLAEALQAVHLRGEVHITVRELRAALVYILFGIHSCDDRHAGEERERLSYWDRAFCADSAARQGDLLLELARFDPALEAQPQIDRYLIGTPLSGAVPGAPRYPELKLESARRRAYFEWSEDETLQVGGNSGVLELSLGRHLGLFRDLPLFTDERLGQICRDLCRGISRLEDLPPKAFDRPEVVPLRITPRTPTETAFWVEKPLAAFRLEATLPPKVEGIERLHRQAALVFRYRGGGEERLRMGAELFHLLLELADGYQLGDVSSDDAFSNLSIFVQRLLQEDAGELLAWNPMSEEAIFRIVSKLTAGTKTTRQILEIAALSTGDK